MSTPTQRKCTERWLPRPAARLTFAEAIASRGAINLRSSVLGAVPPIPTRTSASAAALRWLERYLVESSPSLQHFAEITASLAKR
jgi:hypothetical protein